MNAVVYSMSHPPHAFYLVCSLYTLRKHWDGAVVIYAWPESFELMKQIAKDERLRISEVRLHKPAHRRKNAQFMDKIKVAQSAVDFDVVMYLDADTTIHGDISPIMDKAGEYGFAATQYCNWTTKGNRTRMRIKRFHKIEGLPQSLIERLLTSEFPAINGGVWATKPNNPILDQWYKWAWAARSWAIADETAMHMLMPKYLHLGKMHVLRDGGKWNQSVVYRLGKGLRHEDVVIYHYHGDTALRTDRSDFGVEMWWPIYQHCLKYNVGHIQDWHLKVENKFMKRKQS